MRKLRKFKAGAVVGVVLLTTALFQNCSKGYQAAHVLTNATSSVQCKAEFVAKVVADRLPASELRCDDVASFACERRVFRPNAESGERHESACFAGDCVDVDVISFDTAGAAGDAMPAQFEPGGDYNREEIRCYNRLLKRDMVVIQAEGDSVADAFAKTVRACRAAVGGV